MAGAARGAWRGAKAWRVAVCARQTVRFARGLLAIASLLIALALGPRQTAGLLEMLQRS